MLKVGVSGAAGRVGSSIAYLVEKDEDMELALALEAAGSEFIGTEAGWCVITDDLRKGVKDIDVFIDFTTPAATVSNIKVLAESLKPVVIGTTGLSTKEMDEIETAAMKIPVVFSSNYSIGVNVMWKLLKDATRILKDDYDIDIVEAHHRMKKDAPSGTALATAGVILKEKKLDPKKNIVFGREGNSNIRNRDEIGVFAVRAGGIVGEHTVIFGSMGDKLEIAHTAFSRETFAAGALKAAKFIVGKKPGMYSMTDVLGI